MASVYLHDKEKQEILTERFLDKQSIIDNPEGSIKERGPASDQHNINIIEIPKDLEPHPPQETCWIHRVPEKLRNIRKKAYTPQLVSIGPLHYGNPKLKAMQLHKIKYEQAFWNRVFCKHIPKEERMKFMEKKVLLPEKIEIDWLENFQLQYAVTFEPVDMSELKRVILQDACFISELFLRNYEIQLYNKNMKEKTPEKLPEEIKKHAEDYILRRPWLKAAIRQDLILLENQLPYFVLTDLINSIFTFNHTPVTVPTYLPKLNEKPVRDDFILEIAAEFFLEYYKFGRPPASGAAATTAKAAAAASESTFLGIFHPEKKIDCRDFKNSFRHFTDLVRSFMLPVDRKKSNPLSDSGVQCLYSATQLDRAGVKFRRGDKEARLADIKRKGGLCWLNGCCLDLQVPELSVLDDTECIMRNVMALEQFVYPRELYICNYVFLLDQLISTEEDVQFLIDKKIVSNWLGSNKEVVELVNKLCDQTVISNFFYNELCEELNKHHDNALNVFRATLNRVYFKDLFTISSTAVAAVFLVFSIFSTWLTIKNLFY